MATSLRSTPSPVLDELHDPRWWIRKQVADNLGQQKYFTPDEWYALISLLQDKNTHVLMSALQSLTKQLSQEQTALPPSVDPNAVIDPLLPLLANNDREIRTAASQGLTKLGKPAVCALLKLCEQPISYYESVITDTICGMESAEVVPVLVEASGNTTNTTNTRYFVLKILQEMTDLENYPVFLPILRDWLSESLPEHEEKILIRVLAQMGDAGVRTLGKFLHHASLPQIKSILEELKEFQDKSLPALSAVVALLDSEERTVVSRAASVLSVMGPGIHKEFDRLRKYFLEDSHRTQVEFSLAQALVQVGERALPVFAEALQHSVQTIRRVAAEKLAELGTIAHHTAPLLLHRIREEQDANVKRAMLTTLGKMGESARWGVPDLLELHGQDHEISDDILNAVSAIGISEAELPIVLAIIKDQPNNLTIRELYKAVARLGSQAIPALESWLQKDNETLRTKAIHILAQMDSEAISVLPQVRDILEHSHNHWEVMACLDYLQKMGPKAQDAFSSVIVAFLHQESSHSFSLYDVLKTVLSIGRQRLEHYIPRLVDALRERHPDILQQLLRICDEMLASSSDDVLVTITRQRTPDWPEQAERIREARRILLRKQMSTVVATEDGIEQESEDDYVRPAISFDPAKVRMENRTPTLDLMLKRIAHRELELQPSFQRKTVWTDVMQSRLIESLLLRIPLPSFYVDASDEEKWLVIDGQQRLTAVERFVSRQDDTALRLCGLEFLPEYEGYSYGELPRPLQRRILETQVAVYTVERGTPPDVKFVIFKRINTGGLPLSSQEIRHALYQGPATNFLQQLVESEDFKIATDGDIQDQRMTAQEIVLRSIAFLVRSLEDYQKSGSLEVFLNGTMEFLNLCSEPERHHIKAQFHQAMRAAVDIFGSDAFRKYDGEGVGRRYPINRALFDAWTVNLAKLSPQDLDRVYQESEFIRKAFRDLLKDNKFYRSISTSTGAWSQVRTRLDAIQTLLDSALQHHQENTIPNTLQQINSSAEQES